MTASTSVSVPLLTAPLPFVDVDGCRYFIDIEGRQAIDTDSREVIPLYDITRPEERRANAAAEC